MDDQPGEGRTWAEHWLDRYCPPGEHSFRVHEGRSVVCETCGKNLVVGHSICMVCEIPGEFVATLVRVDGAGPRVHGDLCGPCMDEFSARADIRGWRLVSAGPATDAGTGQAGDNGKAATG